MADGFTLDDVRRMQELEAELMRLREIQEAMSPEELAMLSEDSDMGEAMKYAEQDRDLRRRAEQGDAMANTLLRGEDPPSPQETDPNMEAMPAMRMDGMGAGPMPKRALPKKTMDYTLEARAPLFEKELGLSYQDAAQMPVLPKERKDVPQKKKAEEPDDE
jgi:hypothetical protein